MYLFEKASRQAHPHLNRYLRHRLCSSWLGLQNSGNSGRTAGDLAVLPIAALAAAQDFRGERDVLGS